jgi:hypothetical protein
MPAQSGSDLIRMSMIETGHLLAAALVFDSEEMIKIHTAALIIC